MPRYFIHMAYDGTGYYGWQVQPGQKTVQQAVQNALSTLLRERIEITGAGRTDTGVHASFFVAHFDTLHPIDGNPGSPSEKIPGERSQDSPGGRSLEEWVFKLNRFLPPDIVVFGIKEVTGDLHARFSATYRTYHYHISTVKPLFDRVYAHYVYGKLDSPAIQECCRILLRTSDFTSFSKLHTDTETNICKVMRAEWVVLQKGYRFEIKADRFLRNMVRSVVGTLLEVGMGKLDVEGFREIVEARDRSCAGQSAPAMGLFLVDIGYDIPLFRHD
jgi:tRNA pseudouridine38-40 synthase